MDIVEGGDALLSIRSNNPDLLSDQDPELISQVEKTRREHYKPLSKAVSINRLRARPGLPRYSLN